MRVVAAFAVVVWHYQHFYYQPQMVYRPSVQPFFAVLRPFYLYGYYGVQVFWTISGFIFFWKYGKTISRRAITPGRFAWLRFTRLYPLHLVTLLAVMVLQRAYANRHGFYFVSPLNDLYHFVLNLFFAQWWGLEKGQSLNVPAWSISVEVELYVLFFLLVYLARRKLRVALPCTIIGLTAANMGAPRHDLWVSIACFFVGGVAVTATETLRQFLRSQRALRTTLIALGICTFVSALWIGYGFAGREWQAVILVTTIGIVLAESTNGWSSAIPDSVVSLGNLTYASYMLHFPLQLLTATFFDKYLSYTVLASAWFFSAYVVSTFVAAFLAYHWFERPVQQTLRRMFFTGQQTHERLLNVDG